MGRRGFTLLELMVVIVIAGVLTALSVPNFATFARSLGERGARDQLVQDMRMARQSSVTAHSSVIIAFPGSANVATYTVLVDTDGDRVHDLNERQIDRSLPPRSAIAAVELTPADSIIFDPSGMLAPGTSGGRLVISSAERPDTLNIGPTGMVYRQ